MFCKNELNKKPGKTTAYTGVMGLFLCLKFRTYGDVSYMSLTCTVSQIYTH